MLNVKRPRPTTPDRSGFTLVEILMVIVVIAILMALLLPALQSVRRTALDAKVKTEIMQLETAIGQFKSTFGVAPPSSITLYLDSAGWTQDTTGSTALMRQIWPQIDFNNMTYPWKITPPPSPAQTPPVLNGAESMMFFLGGVYKYGTTNPPIGFSKNPIDPFYNGGAGGTIGSRDGPFIEFDTLRVKDKFPVNQFPEYYDSLSDQARPFYYVSSNDGQGYPVAYVSTDTGITWPSPASAPTGTLFLTIYSSDIATPYKPQSWQIISPGADGSYGSGGLFNPSLSNAGLTNPDDYDNLTNFNSGRLKP